MEIQIKLDTRQLRQALSQLGKNAPVAIMRGLNRTASSVRTQAVRAIASDLNIRQKRVRENVTLTKATPTKLDARIVATPGADGVTTIKLSKSEKAGRIPLFEFHARGRYPSRGKGSGVTYKLPTGKGRLAHAFIAQMASGHKGVFVRLPGTQMERWRGAASSLRLKRLWKREKITEAFGPSIPHVFAKKKILDALERNGNELLRKNMASAIQSVIARRGVSGG